MTSSLLDGRKIRTISIVGNGPISEADAPEIDKADLVLRFNSAPALGVAGQRVDVLMLNRARVYMSKRTNPGPAAPAGVVSTMIGKCHR